MMSPARHLRPSRPPVPPARFAPGPAGHGLAAEGRDPAPAPRRTTEAEALQVEVVALLPALRAFARSLARDRARADDLVQESLLKALSHLSSFDPGSNLRAWLFTILRNTYYSEVRRRRREAEGQSELSRQDSWAGPEQEWSATLGALRAALARLPDDQREAVVLVGAAGLSYEEAAEVCGCALGTIKSRVNRARARLLALMGAEAVAEVVGADPVSLSAPRG